MVEFPVAKINIGLYVTDRRNDGYHNIETIFHPIGFSDILEVVVNKEGQPGTIDLVLSGLKVDGSPATNLVVEAYHLVHEKVGLPGVKAYLHKCIPTGSGLGGGSSDGSSMLMILNRLFELNLSDNSLSDLALRLGSDCPFFLHPAPSFAHGRGEILSPANVSIKGLYLQLYHPGQGISTAAAYRNVAVGNPEVSVESIEGLPVRQWKTLVKNDFEPYAYQLQPVIGRIKEVLYESGAVYASMTGSGSAVYGLFENETDIPEAISELLIWKERLKL